MKQNFHICCLLFLFLLSNLSLAQIGIYNDNNSFICFSCNQLKINSKLEKSLRKMHNVRANNLKSIQQAYFNQSDNLTVSTKSSKNNSDTLFTIMHIGDSHVQGDYFSGEIRIQLQSRFGNAGRGVLFPYALAKSYGPKGVSVKQSGHWNGLKTMTGSLTELLGVTGYAAYTKYSNSTIRVALTEKFREENTLGVFSEPEMQRVRIWHSIGNQSFNLKLNPEFELIDTALNSENSSWGISEFQAIVPQNEFILSLNKTNSDQDQFGFYGFQILPRKHSGLEYHHCGVVGAQFPHLINKAQQTIEQIAYLKPDILVFSFGTNEAYNGKLDTLVYTPTILGFIEKIEEVSPNTTIIFTTPPDTRSSNRIPPHQKNVINQFYKIAKEKDVIVYDLNAAMGGWGSLFDWYKNKLTISDKLHFTPAGYALQGQLFTMALLQAYNRVNHTDTLNYSTLKNHVQNTLQGLAHSTTIKVENDSIPVDSMVKTNVEDRIVEHHVTSHRNGHIHVVKRGETVYAIARKYGVSPNNIIKLNRLKRSRGIKPGQKLKIPRN